MRTALLAVLTVAAVATSARTVSASSCELYDDVTAWPRWGNADPDCGLGMLSEYSVFAVDRLTVQVQTDAGWVDVAATIEESVLPLTVYWGRCTEDCSVEEWTEEVEYLHYQIMAAEPWPVRGSVRLLYRDPIDELDRELISWRIAEPGFGECHTSESIQDPGCYEACPCHEPSEPNDPENPDDDSGDHGIYGCSASGGPGGAAWLIALAAVGFRRRRRSNL